MQRCSTLHLSARARVNVISGQSFVEEISLMKYPRFRKKSNGDSNVCQHASFRCLVAISTCKFMFGKVM